MKRRKLLPKRGPVSRSRATVRRAAQKKKASAAADYFIANKGVKFFSSGCQLLDSALGGGYAHGRIINVIGDKSTGKTLLAIEACANFAMENPKGLIRYKEAEAAFDKGYAAVLGMPLDRVTFEEEFDTVEEFQKDLDAFADLCKKKRTEGLYILDSLDALSDKAEQVRDMEKGDYGAKKARLMSEMFRRSKRKLQRSKVTLIIISQVRDKIGVVFGKRWSRSGGKALDFYASQVLFLAEVKKLRKTVRGVTRAHGVVIKVKIDKNKVGIPFREIDFSIIFGYGIDDILASLEWLKHIKALSKVGLKQTCKIGQEAKRIKNLPAKSRRKFIAKVQEVVNETWIDIEKSFLPEESKY